MRLRHLPPTLLLLGTVACHGSAHAQSASTPAAPAPLASVAAPFAHPPTLAGAPDIATLVAKIRPSVVNIVVDSVVRAPASFENPFEFFFGPDGPRGAPRREGPPMMRRQAQGSGFIVDPRGYVVTNAHVVDGAKVVRVKLADDRELRAHVKGRDERLDLAVLEIDGAKDLPAAALGSSDALRVGEYVVAIGNPFGLGNTVTMGIVSAKSRSIGAGPYDDFIQTDASINPGNSGGPLFDLQGRVVGINTAINPQGQGIGFAIPIDELKEVMPQLLGGGRVARGRLGVVIQPMDASLAKALGMDRPHGALVGDVERGGPADKAGLRAGDVVVSIDGQSVPSARDLPRMVARHAPGSRVHLVVRRAGKEQAVDATLDALKDEKPADASETTSDAQSGGLGVQIDDAPQGGALVRGVVPGSPADGELAPGDVVVEVNHHPIRNAADLKREVQAAPARGSLLMKVEREGTARFVGVDRGR